MPKSLSTIVHRASLAKLTLVGQTVDLPRPGPIWSGSCSTHARDVEDDIDTMSAMSADYIRIYIKFISYISLSFYLENIYLSSYDYFSELS
jgi:hypothetical protein